MAIAGGFPRVLRSWVVPRDAASWRQMWCRGQDGGSLLPEAPLRETSPRYSFCTQMLCEGARGTRASRIPRTRAGRSNRPRLLEWNLTSFHASFYCDVCCGLFCPLDMMSIFVVVDVLVGASGHRTTVVDIAKCLKQIARRCGFPGNQTLVLS